MIRSQAESVLFFLLLFLLPTQLGKHFWPEWSFIYSLPIDYFSPTIYLWDTLVLLLIVVWVLRKPWVNTNALTPLLFFMLGGTLSLFKAQNFGVGLVRLEQFVMVGAFALYIASQSERIKQKVVLPLTLAVIYEGLLASFQFLAGKTLGLYLLGERTFSLATPAIAKFDWFGQLFLRPYGTFPHPNVLAAFMIIIIPLLTFRPFPVLTKLSFLFGAVSVILSFSRTALLVAALWGLVYMRRGLKTKDFRVALIILAVAMPFILVRFSSLLYFDNLSFIRREELSYVALQGFFDSPILGIGVNNFIHQVETTDSVSGLSRFLQPVHNIFLLTLAETGIVGFLTFLFFIGTPFLSLWKRKDYISRILLFLWASILFLGMFDHYFLTLPQGQRLLFLIWGLSMLSLKSGKDHHRLQTN